MFFEYGGRRFDINIKELFGMKTNLPAPRTEEEAYQLMDRLDDEQMVAVITSNTHAEIAGKLYYSFNVNGKLVEGLSKKAIDECCRSLAKYGEFIREEHVLFFIDPSDPQYMLFSCLASRVVLIDSKEVKAESVLGTKRQWMFFKKKDGTLEKDAYWFEKGAMKAARNARERLLPTIVKEAFLSDLRSKKNGNAKQTYSTPKKSPETRKTPIALDTQKIAEQNIQEHDGVGGNAPYEWMGKKSQDQKPNSPEDDKTVQPPTNTQEKTPISTPKQEKAAPPSAKIFKQLRENMDWMDNEKVPYQKLSWREAGENFDAVNKKGEFIKGRVYLHQIEKYANYDEATRAKAYIALTECKAKFQEAAAKG